MKLKELRRGDRVQYASGLVATVHRVGEWSVILRDDEGHEWQGTPYFLRKVSK